MRMKKKRLPGFKPLVTSLPIVGPPDRIGAASSLSAWISPEPRIRPALKASSPLPASETQSLVFEQAAEYKVTTGSRS